ncbi:MAG: 2-oxoacid:acceptor oxidoreductase family protein [Streptomycetaceae bacterium]|nr:2-oxoacid:acceptor oxidoreductase family protein [Streptomycetaceae bacterium]
MQRETLWTGIGGLGVQLATELLAHAAVAEGRHAMFFGSYGGMMRGGNSETTLVLGATPVESPPTVGSAWAAVVLHPAHAAGPLAKLRPDGLLVANATLDSDPGTHPGPAVRIPATELATGVGNPNAVGMVALGAFAAATGIAALDTLIRVLPDVLPAYRHRHIPANEAALRAGHEAATPLLDAWATTGVPA